MREMPCEEIWENLIKNGGYNSAIDNDIISIMKSIRDDEDKWYQVIAKKLNLREEYVELIQYILCTLDYAEYGTSPRGCWLTDKGNEMLELFIKRQELTEKKER